MNTTLRTTHAAVEPFVTKDGSLIRELMHPQSHGCRSQSLAEATVAPGAITALHRHHATEELYHIVAGRGTMTLGEERFEVQPGDTICIRPGTAHCIENHGAEPLRFLCCCAPAYRDDDTEFVAPC